MYIYIQQKNVIYWTCKMNKETNVLHLKESTSSILRS